MAHSISARKRIRQNATRKARNRWRMKTLAECLKDLHEKIIHGSKADATTAFRKACALLDKTASKGVIHKNTAARRKSRLSSRLKTKSLAA